MSQPDDFSAYQPTARHPSERVAWTPRPTLPINTPAAWAIAFTPLVALFFDFGIASALNGTISWTIIGVVAAVFGAASVLLARADRRELDAWGFENTASAWWTLLPPPIYLAIRGNRVWKRTAAGLGPFWASIGVLVSIPVLLRGVEIVTFLNYLL